MKPTPEQVQRVVAQFGMLKYFPSGEAEREAIMEYIYGLVGSVEELAWLRDQMINFVGRWEGSAELRAIYCSYGALTGAYLRGWRPADGLPIVESSHPSYNQAARNAAVEKLEGQNQTKLIEAAETELSAGEIAANEQLMQHARASRFRSLPAPTAQDREASRKLLLG